MHLFTVYSAISIINNMFMTLYIKQYTSHGIRDRVNETIMYNNYKKFVKKDFKKKRMSTQNIVQCTMDK